MKIIQVLFLIAAVINVATTYLLTFYFPAKIETTASTVNRSSVIAEMVDATGNPQERTGIAIGNLEGVNKTLDELELAIALYEQSLPVDHGDLEVMYGIRNELSQTRTAWDRSLALYSEIGSLNRQGVQEWIEKPDSD